MKINSLSIENFKALRGNRSYPDLPDGIIGIVGDNGQGKSNLTRAIAWALYGPLIMEKGMNSADIVSWGEKSAEVNLNFTVDGLNYYVLRQQTGSTAYAELWNSDTANQIAYGSESVTNTIALLLGIDRVGFLASVFSRQKDLEGLASLSGPDRTKTVLRLRGLDSVTRAIESVGQEGRESKKTLTALRAALPNPRSPSEYDSDIKKITAEIKTAEAELDRLMSRKREVESAVKEIVQKQNSLAPKRQAYLDYVSQKATASARLESALNALEKAKVLADRPAPEQPVKPARLPNRKKRDTLAAAIAQDREYVRTLQSTINAEEVCPTCARPYANAAELVKVKADASRSLLQTTKRINKRAEELDALDALIQQEDAYWTAFERWGDLHGRWKESQDAVGAHEKAVEVAEAALAGLDPVPDVSSEYDSLLAESRIKQAELSHVAERVAEAIAEEKRLNRELDALNLERIKSISMAKELGGLEKRSLELEVGVSQLKEFKQLQTATLIPDITTRASDILSQLTEGKYSEIVLTPEWDIQYRYEDGELKTFPNLSVGERNVFALSLRLALADLQAGKIGLLVLDEVLDALDENRQNLTWGVVESLLNRYSQVFMITHVAAFKERAPFLIQL